MLRVELQARVLLSYERQFGSSVIFFMNPVRRRGSESGASRASGVRQEEGAVAQLHFIQDRTMSHKGHFRCLLLVPGETPFIAIYLHRGQKGNG